MTGDPFYSDLTLGKVTVEWVPSHMGIRGNELADTLAKASLSLSYTTQLPPSLDDLKHKTISHYTSLWDSSWKSTISSFSLNLPSVLSIPPYLSLHRRDQICLTRLYLNTSRLTHEHFFNKSPPAVCSHCNVRWTVCHLLVACPALEPERSSLRLFCNSKDLPMSLKTLTDPDFPTKLILKFLEDTEMKTKI